MEFLKEWVVGIAAVLAGALSIWNFIQSPAKKNADDLSRFKDGEFATFRKAVGDDIKLLDTAVDDTRARVTTLETIVQQMPDKDALHRLELQLEQLNTRIAGMAASAEATQRTAGRVEQFLLDQGKK